MSQSGDDQSGGRNNERAGDLGAVKRRLEALEGRLEAVRGRRVQAESRNERRGKAMSAAFRLALEMVVGVVVGGVVGWYLDAWLGTRPFLLIVFLLLGSAAGILNAVRTAREMQEDAANSGAADRESRRPKTREDESGNGAPG